MGARYVAHPAQSRTQRRGGSLSHEQRLELRESAEQVG